jgi:hypothetical protein
VRLFRAVLLLVGVLLASFYAADYVAARTRPQGSVEVHPYYAIPQKDGKTEIVMLDPETDSCVHSLLPHLGLQSCWYLNKHKQKRIDM